MTQEEFVAQCRSFLGVRFWHCGRNRRGVDCAGLIVAAATELGVELYDEKRYQKEIDPTRLAAGVARNCRLVPTEDRQAGDVLFFRPHHLGVYTGEETFVHAWDSFEVVCETHLEGGWQRLLVAVYRWNGWE